MAVKYTQAVIFDSMDKKSIKQLCYLMFICLTCLSFGTYVLLENFKMKTESVSKDVAGENAESGKETSKELTSSYLFEKAIILLPISFSNLRKFTLLAINISSFSHTPNTPPPDLFES